MPTAITNRQIAERAHRHLVATNYEDADILYYEQVSNLMADLPDPHEFRTGCNLFAYVEQGSASANFNGREVTANEQHGIICPSSTSVSNISVGPQSEVHLLCISD